MPLPKKSGPYTWADLMTTGEDERIELVKGIPFTRTTPPKHQEVLLALLLPIANFLHDRPEAGELYPGPFCLRPFERTGDTPENIDTVLEPDLSLICDRSRLDDWGCKGPPDWIAEITAPCTVWHDWFVKRHIYEAAGVGEYWIVEPERRAVTVFRLENGGYAEPAVYTGPASVPVAALEGCTVDLASVFRAGAADGPG